MAVNRSATVSVTFARSLLFFGVISCLFTFFTLVVFLAGSRRYVRDYRVDDRAFREAVYNALSNLVVSRVASSAMTVGGYDPDPISGPSLPQVEICDRWAFWEDFSGSHCEMDGVRYSVGDYCKFGYIRAITPISCYCESATGMIIVKHREKPVADDGRKPRSGSAASATDLDESGVIL